jgi:hypothetical protein
MKTSKILLITVCAVLCLFVLTSFTKEQKNATFPNGRIIIERTDGRTFYILIDSYGNPINFIEKR